MSSLIPLPKKLFSLIPPPIVSPLVPKPADNEISPVGLSSTSISIILKFLEVPSLIFDLTFLNIPKQKLENVKIKEALNHPNWKMGEKISIDSSTLMNKSLEIIEASVLFGVDANKIDVVIHPQHIVHSMVEFKDGSILSNLSAPDMKASISYGLGFPKRLESGIERLSFSDLSLNFFEPDHKKFPTLDYAKKALSLGGNLPLILNSFNEVAVDLFLQEKINYLDIFQLISHAFDAKDNLDINIKFDTVDEILHLEALSKKQAKVYAERYTF